MGTEVNRADTSYELRTFSRFQFEVFGLFNKVLGTVYVMRGLTY